MTESQKFIDRFNDAPGKLYYPDFVIGIAELLRERQVQTLRLETLRARIRNLARDMAQSDDIDIQEIGEYLQEAAL